jgi:hypothetical protein
MSPTISPVSIQFLQQALKKNVTSSSSVTTLRGKLVDDHNRGNLPQSEYNTLSDLLSAYSGMRTPDELLPPEVKNSPYARELLTPFNTDEFTKVLNSADVGGADVYTQLSHASGIQAGTRDGVITPEELKLFTYTNPKQIATNRAAATQQDIRTLYDPIYKEAGDILFSK